MNPTDLLRQSARDFNADALTQIADHAQLVHDSLMRLARECEFKDAKVLAIESNKFSMLAHSIREVLALQKD